MSTSGQSVATQFLQTVVVVDDHAYRSGPPLVEEEATLGDESPDVVGFKGIVDAASSSTDELPPDPEDFATETVVEGFADLGISCTAIAPDINDLQASSKRLIKLAVRSDVVILDWLIRPLVADAPTFPGTDVERTSIDLLVALLRADKETDARVRLICIYTGTRELVPVLEQIESHVRQHHSGASMDRTQLCIDASGTRIVILAKARSGSVPGQTTVSASELPGRVVEEFHKFAADGILPRLALASVAAVRRRTHRLLGRFGRNMDPALIAHRSTTSHSDAVAFAVALVGEELASILESEKVADDFDEADFDAVISDYLAKRSTFMWWKAFPDSTTSKKLSLDEAREALSKGVESSSSIRGASQKASLTSLMVAHDEDNALNLEIENGVRRRARSIDFEFSALSSLARDGRLAVERLAAPRLHVGTLLKLVTSELVNTESSSANGRLGTPNESARAATIPSYIYWMCVQPLCDSVRLSTPTRFPFVPLVKCGIHHEGFDLVAYDTDEYVPLRIDGRRFRDVEFFVFDPHNGIVEAVWRTDRWTFTASDGTSFAWLGQVRTAKAQTLLTSVVGSAGRLGIDEYDYLRRMSNRAN